MKISYTFYCVKGRGRGDWRGPRRGRGKNKTIVSFSLFIQSNSLLI